MSKQNQNHHSNQYPVYPHNYQHPHQQHPHPSHLHPHPQQYWPQYPYMGTHNQGYYAHQQPPMVYGNYQYHPQQYSQYQPHQTNQIQQSHQNHQQYDRNVNQRSKKQQKIHNTPKRDQRPSNKDISMEDNDIINSDSNQSEEQEDEEIIYQKTKMITKKRDPVLDTPQQILKWIQARKKNYPSKKKNQITREKIGDEMSILESKIRKKITLVTSDGKGLMKKLKNMHILKRLINDPNSQVKKKNIKNDGKETIKKIKQKNIKNQPMNKIIQEKEEICKEKKKIQNNEEENKSQNQQSQQKQISIRKQPKIEEINIELKKKEQEDQQKGSKVSGLTPEDMIKHLRQKQTEDKQFYDQLLSYKTNSLNYKYSSKTLQTNFLLQDIFEQSSYLLQIIRYIAKKNFFDISDKNKQ